MKHPLLLSLIVSVAGGPAEGAVSVLVRDNNGRAAIEYECTAGERIQSFALDVTVNQGHIVAITHYFRGPNSAHQQGYGIFPASFREHIVVASGTNANWDAPAYSPLAVVTDHPGDTLPGLGSSGVTLEFGTLWETSIPTSAPSASGTLCWLEISQAAQVSITPNARRGGVILASTGESIAVDFSSAVVDPTPRITSIALTNGVIAITFQGGDLEAAPGISGPWTGTGNETGTYTTNASAAPERFFRVRRPDGRLNPSKVEGS